MNKKGFTLIELLIVVALVGIHAAIAITHYNSAIVRTKQRRTMVDMRTIATAWESRTVETNRYNAAAAGYQGIDQPVGLDDLEGALAPTYVRQIPKFDGWSHPFLCFTDTAWGGGTRASQYAIISLGADNTVDPTTVPGPTTNYDCDIIFSSGVFLVYPEGVQQQ
jgi:prepilin-type N-terminal cleavage/methylation domain-containing protein